MRFQWRFTIRVWLFVIIAYSQCILSQTKLLAQHTGNTERFSVNRIFTDHMVLQRDQPIHIWGKGLPGAKVRIELLKNTTHKPTKVASELAAISKRTTIVTADSTWSVYLPAMPASVTPHELKITSGKTHIQLQNILIGDIWVCIGQSNMEWPMQREMFYNEAKANADQPLLRFYNPSYAGKNIFNQYFSDSVLQLLSPDKFFAKTQWEQSDSNHFKTMSAVAYYYGKEIAEKTKVPVGLIHLSIAGASLETFISTNALRESAAFAAKANEPWLTNLAMPLWVKERGNQNLQTGTLHPFKPGHSYEAGIQPLFPLAIKGIINYQGESNAQEIERVQEYAALSELMVNDYRKQWRQPELPYYYVQLSSIDTAKYKGHFWGSFREEQRKMMDLIPFSGMAVSSDIGFKDNVHPANKKWVGERLARWALHKTYHQPILSSGPLPTKALYENGKVIVYFRYTGEGLQVALPDDLKRNENAETQSLRGFSLDGIHPIAATIQQQTIHIPVSSKPDFIYYGWKSYSDGNLVNSEKLPASTFKIKVDKAPIVLPTYPDSIFTTYYHQRVSLFRSIPISAARNGKLASSAPNTDQLNRDIIFLGNSINDGSEWAELFNDKRIKNRGISGDITAGIIHRLNEVAERKPAKVFLMIGINDLGRSVSPDSVVKNILLINDYLQQESPSTKVFIESILPVNPSFGKFAGQVSKVKEIIQANAMLQAAAKQHQYEYIDLHSSFVNAQGYLDAQYTNDGLHLVGAGYQLWRHLIYPKVFGLTGKPALIPMPKQVAWKQGFYSLMAGKTLAEQVQIEWNNTNKENNSDKKKLSCKNELLTNEVGAKEAYDLKVTPEKILIKASTHHGVFNALQTLQQLARNGQTIDAVEIQDAPAFAWRGYMIDVGRNYLSMDLLKQQIEMMAKYKLNVLHFHATEDIAWRIASKQYPQLTAPEHMLRNKGMYYSEAEIKELIAYCKARNILFVPEIDMPGHSAAFKRAMKTDMQSDSGLVMIKNILKEFCTTYDVPYIHIGADEVKITNPNFIPEVTKHIQSFGKKVIGWQPGGNFLDSTIRQLWMDDLGKITNDKQIQYIDSRHLYLNHMDPLEAVTTLFNRQLANKDHGDQNALGAIICTWHDRAVEKQEDILQMNPVYPAMMAFAERSWRGGGQAGWIANISDGDVTAFAEFEARLLDHRKLSFPYQRQSHLEWQLYDANEKFIKTVTGGTVVLRHWWAPLIKGAIDSIQPNTTWYAQTEIWSDEIATKPFWIGFNNLSRSPATDSHPMGEWSFNKPAVWVNNQLITPPTWKRGGQKGNAEIPLSDEGYEYRAPTMIALQKGWNKVQIKIPIDQLKGKDWQNPAKYMFTFVPVE